MALSRPYQPAEPVRLDIEAVFERVYNMLEESEVEPNFQSRWNTKAENISNGAASEISLEDILSLDEDWLYYDNNSNQEHCTDGSDGEAVQEYYSDSYADSLEYDNITESISDEMVDYDSNGSEPIHEYHNVNRRSVWVSETGEHYYGYSNPEEKPFIQQFTCDMCNSNYWDQHTHQRFHEIVEWQMMQEKPVTCSMCYAAYTNEKQHLRFHEIASLYYMENLFGKVDKE